MKHNTRKTRRNTELIVALDVDDLAQAERLVELLYPSVKIFKIGSQLFTGSGPKAVEAVNRKGAHVFLDLKFHDIPNTVYSAVSKATVMRQVKFSEEIEKNVKDTTQSGIFMITVHTLGGAEMLQAAVKAAAEKAKELNIKRPLIVGVTRLTSQSDKGNLRQEVLAAARLAKDAGLDGVVCSVHEAASIRRECGDDFVIVTPGIRPQGSLSNDQSRVATPQRALEATADFIVVGRPIIKAEDPRKAADGIIKEII